MPCDLHPGRALGGLIMFKDPIVEEVRAVRKKHAERFNFNLRKIAEDLRAKEQQSGRKVSLFRQPSRKKAAV